MNAFDTSYMKPSSYVTETRKHICYVFLGNYFFQLVHYSGDFILQKFAYMLPLV